MWYTNTMERYSALKKEGNPVICYDVDKPWGDYGKSNKTVTKK